MSIQDLDTHTSEPSSVPIAPAGEESDPSPAADVPSASPETKIEIKLCGVCNKNPPRYKCPRCRLPYCSLTCSRTHKQTHTSPTPPPSKPPTPPPSTTPSTSLRPPRAGTLASSTHRSPFAGLESSPELHELFTRYPRLRARLDVIFNATLPPTSGAETERQPVHGRMGYRKRGEGQEAWTHDKGLEKGVRELGVARAECGGEGEGVREFSSLVLRLVEGREEGDGRGSGNGERRGDEWGGVWREEVEESVRAVERLLRGES